MTPIAKLKAIKTLRSDKDLIELMADFKRAEFVGSYIMEKQAETEEELTLCWLSDLETQIYYQDKKVTP